VSPAVNAWKYLDAAIVPTGVSLWESALTLLKSYRARRVSLAFGCVPPVSCSAILQCMSRPLFRPKGRRKRGTLLLEWPFKNDSGKMVPDLLRSLVCTHLMEAEKELPAVRGPLI